MQIGISAFAWTAKFERSHLNILPAVKAMGLNAVEIPMFDPFVLPVESIKAACEENGLECTVCAILPKSLNPISPNSTTRQKAINHLIRCVEVSAEMGAKLLGGPLFAPIGYLPNHRPRNSEWMWAVETFRGLSAVLDDNDMILSLEPVNRSETFFLRTAADAKHLSELVGNPRIGVTIDTFHANIEETNIAEAVLSLGTHLKHIHASENDRGPLGRGHVPFPEIVAALKACHFNGYLIIEGFGYSAAEKNAPGWLWASTDISPETLAVESAKHLKRILTEAN